MSRSKFGRRCVALCVLGVGGYLGWDGLAAWRYRNSPQAADTPTVAAVAQAANAGNLPSRIAVDAELEPLVEAAIGADLSKSEAATKELRSRGQRALQYVIGRTDSTQMPKWKELADTIAAQRDSHFSGLYWYTDLEAAKTAAQRENKPILSLRLLGKLTDELSCANSRFFRTTLYPQAAVRSLLSERFVLHWESVRKVPIITIDFGDGRSIKRTITGNSLHLVLDARGRSVDVIPGMYGAGFFARVLQQSESLAQRAAQLDDQQFIKARSEFHQQQLRGSEARWVADWQALKTAPAPQLGAELDDGQWAQLAQRYAGEVVFDHAGMRAVTAKQPAEVAGRLAMTKIVAELPMLRMVRNLQPVVAQDTVKNEYKLHRQIHQRLITDTTSEARLLTSWIYQDLFLSPLEDPWYGLSSPDVYSAVANDGRHYATAAP